MIRRGGVILGAALALIQPALSGPAMAQTEPDGIFRFMFDNLWNEGGPDLGVLSEGLEHLGPIVAGLAEMIDDPRNFHAPETLPNGDILLRRRQDAPEAPPPIDPDQPQISL